MSENGNKAGKGKCVPNSHVARWRPGQSGNPSGRPRRAAFSEACRDVLAAPVTGDRDGRTYAQAIAWKLAEMARAGDVRAAVELADRAEGRVRQAVEMENAPLTQAFERMTEAELRDSAERGALPDWFQEEASSAPQYGAGETSLPHPAGHPSEHPAENPVGSIASRAAARAILERRERTGNGIRVRIVAVEDPEGGPLPENCRAKPEADGGNGGP
jgi:hypothetical protein